LIIWGDEASFNCWMRSRRTWSTKEEPVKVVLNEKRNSGITVYGAIGAAMERPLFKQFKTTNKEDFLSFLTEIRGTLPEQYKDRTIKLVLDNHKSHGTLLVRSYCQFNNIEIKFLPSYSPEFNCIEPLWSVVKRRFKQKLIAENDILIN
jgi:transposase